MHESFLSDLAIVLSVAGVTCSLALRFKVPLILSYLLAGLIIGPYIPVPLFASHERVEELAEFGVVFVMFCVGLEFQFRKLFQIIGLAGLTAVTQISLMFAIGYGLGLSMGWTVLEALFLGGSISISSTMVVSKVLDNSKPTSARETILGVLILQDIAAVIMIAALTAVAAGAGLSAAELGRTLGELIGVLAAMIVVGYLVIPRLIQFVDRLDSQEAMTIVACGICFGMAYLAETFGYSVALGAFVAGMLVSESGLGLEVERILLTLKDLFAAIFFVSIGMTVDPLLAIKSLPVAIGVAFAVVVGQFFVVTTAGLLSGNGLRRSVTSGVALGQVGEFAFIIAAVGISARVVKVPLQSILVTVAVITTFTTPFFFGRIEKIIGFVDRKFPSRFRLLLTFYEGWLDRLKSRQSEPAGNAIVRRIFYVIFVDALLSVLICVISAIFWVRLDETLTSTGFGPATSDFLIALGTVLLLAPFVLGIFRNVLKLSSHASGLLFPSSNQQSSVLLRRILVGPVIAFVALPFFALLSGLFETAAIFEVFLVLVTIGAIYFWRRVGDFQAEVHSGARSFVELIAQDPSQLPAGKRGEPHIPGLHQVTNYKIEDGSSIGGKTLAEVNLRALTGTTVISIVRDGEEVILPTGRENLKSGDVLVLAGTKTSTEKAISMLK